MLPPHARLATRPALAFDDVVRHEDAESRPARAGNRVARVVPQRGPCGNREGGEPLALEAQHFIDCIRTGSRPLSDGEAGTQVVAVLEYGQRSLDQGGAVVTIPPFSGTAQPLAA